MLGKLQGMDSVRIESVVISETSDKPGYTRGYLSCRNYVYHEGRNCWSQAVSAANGGVKNRD